MEGEKHGRGVEQACRMLDLFASVGVRAFDITWTDMDGRKRKFRPAQRFDTLRRWMPSLLRSAIECGENLIVRPQRAGVVLVQLDDLVGAMLERLRSSSFMTLMTSAGNYQAWVAVQECGPDFARRLRQGSGGDPHASGATRVAGSVNFKRRYAPEFPTVQIVEATPQRTVQRSELEARGLVAAPVAVSASRAEGVHRDRRAKAWPSYERCLQDAPLAHHSDRPDVSRSDFTFCLLAIDWGWSLAETRERLREKSSKARENGEGYVWLTVQRAAAAVYRRHSRISGIGPPQSPVGLLDQLPEMPPERGCSCDRTSGHSRVSDSEERSGYSHPQVKLKTAAEAQAASTLSSTHG